MILTRKIQQGLTIYDYSNILLGGFDNIIKGILQQNPEFESMDVSLGDFVTQDLVYDDQYYTDRAVQIELSGAGESNTTKQITGRNGQNIYDLNLMGYSGFNNVVQFMRDNNINSINDQSMAFRACNFDLALNEDQSLTAVIEKRGIVFGSLAETRYRLTEDGDYRITESGERRIINGR